ncbi:MAG: hypothetical protein AAGC44_10215 [Planctomycetota bacterium]
MSRIKTPKTQRGLAHCPHCQTPLAAPLEAAGRPARCNSCGQRFTLPPAEELFSDAVAYIVEREDSKRSREAFDSAAREIQYEAIRNVEIG